MVMPLKLYNFDCPYCGTKNSIDIMSESYTVKGEEKNRNIRAYCTKCDMPFAMNYDETGNYFSDFDEAFKQFMNAFEEEEKRDIDEYLLRLE